MTRKPAPRCRPCRSWPKAASGPGGGNHSLEMLDLLGEIAKLRAGGVEALRLKRTPPSETSHRYPLTPGHAVAFPHPGDAARSRWQSCDCIEQQIPLRRFANCCKVWPRMCKSSGSKKTISMAEAQRNALVHSGAHRSGEGRETGAGHACCGSNIISAKDLQDHLLQSSRAVSSAITGIARGGERRGPASEAALSLDSRQASPTCYPKSRSNARRGSPTCAKPIAFAGLHRFAGGARRLAPQSLRRLSRRHQSLGSGVRQASGQRYNRHRCCGGTGTRRARNTRSPSSGPTAGGFSPTLSSA